jgi:ElaB/YqjD/DUF883 family membrane-anchored ribosome-binding protein
MSHPNAREIMSRADALERIESEISRLMSEAESLISGTSYAADARAGWVRSIREGLSESPVRTTVRDTIDIMREDAPSWS